MTTKLSGMAVTVTLVFSDECHREAWLEQEGVISEQMPPMIDTNGQTEWLLDDKDDVLRKQVVPPLFIRVGRDPQHCNDESTCNGWRSCSCRCPKCWAATAPERAKQRKRRMAWIRAERARCSKPKT